MIEAGGEGGGGGDRSRFLDGESLFPSQWVATMEHQDQVKDTQRLPYANGISQQRCD